MNRTTGEQGEIEAQSATEAYWMLGWMIGDCYIQEKGVVKHDTAN